MMKIKNFRKPVWLLIIMFTSLPCSHTMGAKQNQQTGTLKIEAEDFDVQYGVQSETCSEGGQNIGWIEKGDYIKFNAIDVSSQIETIAFRAASSSDGGTINMYVDDKSGTPHATIHIDGTGAWQNWETFTDSIPSIQGVHDLYFEFDGGAGFLFNLNWIELGAAVQVERNISLIFPYDEEELTDIACSFKAKTKANGPFELQLCRDRDFSSTIVKQSPQKDRATGAEKDGDDILYFLSYQGKLKPSEKWILEPGVWYWRITADGGLSYSEVRKLSVNNDRTLTPRAHEISPRHPLFHFRLGARPFAYTNNAGEALAGIIPDNLRDVMVIDIGLSFRQFPAEEYDLFKYSKMYNDLGYKFSVDFGGASTHKRIVSAGEIEKIYRDLPNFVGGEIAEVFYNYPYIEADNSQLRTVIELSRKYGKFCMCADMNWKFNKWQLFNYEFYDEFMREQYNDYFLPVYKTTDPWGAYLCHSALQGMKLSGMVNNIGIWSDQWTWEKFGDVNTISLDEWLVHIHDSGLQQYYPYIQHMKDFIYGMSYGSTVFMVEPELQWDWSCKPNDLYFRYMLPFMQAVVTEHIIPSKEAVNKNYHVMVDTEFSSSNRDKTEPITYLNGNVWGDFLKNTYGIANINGYNETIHPNSGAIKRSAYLESIPNSDRYPSGIPFLPKPSVKPPWLPNKELAVVKISDMKTQQGVDRLLNPYYPESENQAFAVKVDSSLFVFNTYENHDRVQAYTLGVHHAGIDSLYGNIHLMSYVMGRIRPDGESLFIQTNAHVKKDYEGGRYGLKTYPSILHFKCQVQPQIRSNEMSAITTSWNETSGIFSVTIDHTTAGAVDFVLSGDKAVSYQVDSIYLAQKEMSIHVQQHKQLSAQLYPSSSKGIGVTWRSLNPTIARVTRKGWVSGVKPGITQLIAEVQGISDTVLCKVESDVNIRDTRNHNLEIYPNPAHKVLWIQGLDPLSEIQIFNLAGQLKLRTAKHTISLKDLLPGVYIIQVLSNDGTTKTQQFIKQ